MEVHYCTVKVTGTNSFEALSFQTTVQFFTVYLNVSFVLSVVHQEFCLRSKELIITTNINLTVLPCLLQLQFLNTTNMVHVEVRKFVSD